MSKTKYTLKMSKTEAYRLAADAVRVDGTVVTCPYYSGQIDGPRTEIVRSSKAEARDLRAQKVFNTALRLMGVVQQDEQDYYYPGGSVRQAINELLQDE